MRNVMALTRREFMSFMHSPIAYLTAFVFLAMIGLLFTGTTLVSGNESTVRPLFVAIASVLVLCVPVLTMRLLSDEYASGTIESLMTAPVTDFEVVISKFLGVLMFYLILVALTVVHVVAMAQFGPLDWGVTAVSYLGLILLGALYLAVGVFASSLTKYQIVAAIIGIAMLATMTFVTDYLSLQFPNSRSVLAYMNVLGQFEQFARGMFDSAGCVYFLSTTGLFLFMAVKVLESRRWR